MQTYDPWERMNRFTYRFNARFDEAVFLPVANGYGRLPDPLRLGVHHFFANLSELVSVINYTAQLRLAPGVRSLGRFVINSTLGLGGLFDVAQKLQLPGAPTGFGAAERLRVLRRFCHLLRDQHCQPLPRRRRLGADATKRRRRALEHELPL